MKFKTFASSYALVSIVFGAGFLAAPGLLLSIYGVKTDLSFNYIGQLFGAALISLAALAWLGRNISEPQARNAIVLALLVGEAIGFVVALIGQFNGALNMLGWSVVAVYLLLAAGLAYFYFAKPA